MIDPKEAQNHFPIHLLLKKRWSPRAFSDKTIETEKLLSVFEAARWSASAANQQPWRFIIGLKGEDSWQKIFESLDHYNQVWCHMPFVLGISCGRTLLNDDKGANPYYAYDTGQSLASLSIQATAEGLFVHQMGGFNKEKVREHFEIPEIFEPLTAFAIGYLGNPSDLDEHNQKRETHSRERTEIKDLLFSGKFGQKSGLLK
ncbi:MAG: nitroreductase family protein [Bacteroidota bacterium]